MSDFIEFNTYECGNIIVNKAQIVSIYREVIPEYKERLEKKLILVLTIGRFTLREDYIVIKMKIGL